MNYKPHSTACLSCLKEISIDSCQYPILWVK